MCLNLFDIYLKEFWRFLDMKEFLDIKGEKNHVGDISVDKAFPFSDKS